MKFIKYLIITISTSITVLLLIPLIAFIILHFWILTPNYLTGITKQIVHEYTNLRFNCRSIELEYINSWPSLSIAINDGEIFIPFQEDTTITNGNISFKKLYGNIQLSELLKNKTLQLKDLHLLQSNSNWNVGKKMPTILKKETPKTFNNFVLFGLSQIDVSNASINIRSQKSKKQLQLQNASASFSGDFISQSPSFNVDIFCDKAISSIQKETVSISLKGRCQTNKRYNYISFNETSLLVNQFPFQLSGNISKKDSTTNFHLGFDLSASNLDEIIDFIPKEHLQAKNDFLIKGNTKVRGEINGPLNASNIPNLKLECIVDNGSFYKKGIKSGIDTINLYMKLNYIHNVPDSCFLSIENAKVSGLNSYLEVESHISNLQKIPFINADFKGYIDFDYIGKEFIPSSTANLTGKIESNFSIAANLSDLQEKNLHRIWANGDFNANKVEIKSPKHNLDVFISGTEAEIKYKKNKSDFIKQDEVLTTTAQIDTLKINYNNSIDMNLSQLSLRSNTTLNPMNKRDNPVTVHLDCKSLNSKFEKQRWFSAQDLIIHAGTKNFLMNNTKSNAACVVNAKELKYLDKENQNIISLYNTEFITELHSNEQNKWDIKGIMNFKNSKIYTSYYPTIINAKHAQLSFSNNQLSFNHLKLNIGDSDCIVSGILTKNNIGEKPLLEGTLHVLSDYINYNELKDIFLYETVAQNEIKALNSQNLRIEQLEDLISKSSTQEIKGRAFYIPKGIQLNLLLNIGNMSYEEVELHQVNGDVIISNQKVYSQLKTRTNLGKVQLEALYDSSQKDNLKLLFDLNLQDVLLAQIQNGIPTISTLFPLVKTMNGLMDCHLTVSSQLNSQMHPILSTTTAACSLEGQNLSLSNNEIIDNIAKKFKFKNKKETIIKHIATNLILKDNIIEVIPFQMAWDRYEAIIGGTHTTDHNYNYHITMLESIIPIDFGVNLSGKPDDFHYKLGKCQYKGLYNDGGKQHDQNTKKRLSIIRDTITNGIKL